MAGIATYTPGCGPHVYKLIDGDTTYLKFDESTRVLTLNTVHHSDVGVNFPTLGQAIPAKSHTIRAYGSRWPDDYIESSFTVTILPCTLINKVISPQIVHLGQRKDWDFPAFTWTHPTGNYLSACGAITYELEGTPYTYVDFAPATRMITLYTNLDSDIRGATGRKIRAYPLNFPPIYV